MWLLQTICRDEETEEIYPEGCRSYGQLSRNVLLKWTSAYFMYDDGFCHQRLGRLAGDGSLRTGAGSGMISCG
jgi:hypothetical protein